MIKITTGYKDIDTILICLLLSFIGSLIMAFKICHKKMRTDITTIETVTSACILGIFILIYILLEHTLINDKNGFLKVYTPAFVLFYLVVSSLVLEILFDLKKIKKDFLHDLNQINIYGPWILCITILFWLFYLLKVRKRIKEINKYNIDALMPMSIKSILQALIIFLGVTTILSNSKNENLLYFGIILNWFSAFLYPILDIYKYYIEQNEKQ